MANTTSQHAPSDDAPRVVGDLRRRVLGWMLLASLLPVVIMAGQGYHCAMQALVARTDAHLNTLLEERADRLAVWMDERTKALRGVVDFPGFADSVAATLAYPDSGFDAPAMGFLDVLRKNADEFDYVVLIKNGSDLVLSSPPGIPEALLSGSFAQGAADTWFRDAAGGGLYLTLTEDVTSETAVQVRAFVNLSRSMDAILITRSNRGETVSFAAFFGEDQVLEGPARDLLTVAGVVSKLAETGKAPQALPESSRRIDSVAGVGYRIAIGYTELPGHPSKPITLIAVTEEAQALSWLKTLQFRAVITGSITLVFLLFLATWISDRLGQPLAELARVAHRIRKGHPAERLEAMGGAEAEEVRRAVNLMLDEMQEQQQALARSASLASIGELSSSIVHEMRNPLSSIKMNLQGLQRTVQGDPRDTELATIASEQVNRVENMLDDLLHYGRPIELKIRSTTFQELVDAAMAVALDPAREKGIQFDVSDTLNGGTLKVDLEQMTRALTNLLLNAIEVSPENARVRLSARHDGERPGRICVDVADEGPGFGKEARERLFKPFFTTRPNGTGLGLANVRKIMELHGGEATAENGAGSGAVFTLHVPSENSAP